MLDNVDMLVCGAGPAGCVLSERAAACGWNVLVVDKRLHVAGNTYDCRHDSGVLIHPYGPHYFRTNDADLLHYLSRFTDWLPGNYIVKSYLRGKLYPFPINLTTLEMFFGRHLDPAAAECLLQEKRIPIAQPRNSEEYVLSRVGQELYEQFYLNYTLKQWQLHPRELLPNVCGRIPVRLNRDERYVEHRFQVMPRLGFTTLFTRMLQHPRIRVLLGCSFQDIHSQVLPRHATVYTGPIDAYFGYCHGKLPYRSLEFDFVPYQQEFLQPCVQINYPNDFACTRSVEIKHVTGQRHSATVISYERPRSMGEPFYPIPTEANLRLYERYKALAEAVTREQRVYFCGRLAQYRYFNTDEVISEALRCFEEIRRRCARPQDRSALSYRSAAA